MKKLALFLAAAILSINTFTVNAVEIEAGNPVELIGHASKYATVTGTVSDVEFSEKYKVIFLNFGKNFNTSLTAVIYNDVVPNFIMAGIEEPAEYYKNKTVALEGFIRISDGKPEIVIESPSQIRIVNNK